MSVRATTAWAALATASAVALAGCGSHPAAAPAPSPTAPTAPAAPAAPTSHVRTMRPSTPAERSLARIVAQIGVRWQKASGPIRQPDAVAPTYAHDRSVGVEMYAGVKATTTPFNASAFKGADSWGRNVYGVLCIADTSTGVVAAWAGDTGHTTAAVARLAGHTGRTAINTALQHQCKSAIEDAAQR